MYSEDTAPAAAEVALECGWRVTGRSMGNMGMYGSPLAYTRKIKPYELS